MPSQVDSGQVATINLTENSDISTVMHETAHFALNYLQGIGATSQLKTLGIWWAENSDTILKGTDCTAEDLNTFCDELLTGVKSENLTDEKRATLNRATQEYFARGFEAYLKDGKSPNAEMKGIFRKMRQWLVEIYDNMKRGLNVQLNDEVRQLFDRLVASDKSIERAIALDGLDISEETQWTAKEIFFSRVMDELTREDAQIIKDFREARRGQIRQELQDEPLYRAVDAIMIFNGLNYAVRFKFDVSNIDRSLRYKDHKVVSIEIEESPALRQSVETKASIDSNSPQGDFLTVSIQQLTNKVKPMTPDDIVFDKNGEPKVFYHYTDADFSIFDINAKRATNAGWLGAGFYFSGSEHAFSNYGKNKLEVFLKTDILQTLTSQDMVLLDKAV